MVRPMPCGDPGDPVTRDVADVQDIMKQTTDMCSHSLQLRHQDSLSCGCVAGGLQVYGVP